MVMVIGNNKGGFMTRVRSITSLYLVVLCTILFVYLGFETYGLVTTMIDNFKGI